MGMALQGCNFFFAIQTFLNSQNLLIVTLHFARAQVAQGPGDHCRQLDRRLHGRRPGTGGHFMGGKSCLPKHYLPNNLDTQKESI